MRSPLVWLLFFLSGACGLVYEVLWTRELGLIFGHTVQSLSAVLSAFMAGLALGSFLAGRRLAKPRRLLLVYGLLEIFIGLYCAALPWLFDAVTPLYARLYGDTGSAGLPLARFVISFLLLLVPATCMGATLPVLSQFMTRTPVSMARTAGALYAVNTLGAVLGAAGTGFFLLPLLGRAASNWTAVTCNLLLGLTAIWLGTRAKTADLAAAAPGAAPQAGPGTKAGEPVVEVPVAVPEEGSGGLVDGTSGRAGPLSPRAVRAAALAFGLTGFAAMATQIGWTRALSLALGSSTYAFSLIVAIFILGLALGGAWGARVAPRLRDPLATLARVLLLIGLLAMVVTAALGWAPLVFFWLIAVGSQWGFGALLAFEALGVAALLIFPTFLMGATMPLTMQVAQAGARLPGGVGRTVGNLYALNTAGSILGSLLGGLVLLPLLQIQNTLKLTALLYVAPGVVLFLLSPSAAARPRARWAAGALAALGVALCALPGWDPLRMSAGAYLLRQPAALQAAREGRWRDAVPRPLGDRVLYYREGATATVAVFENPLGLSLAIGGKPDATSYDDMTTQVGLTLLPELLHAGGPAEVLVIGMGSGVSVGAALAPASVTRVDLVEISPEVIEASACFAPYSGLRFEERDGPPWLTEPKVEVLINDGRNHLALTRRRYDVISSEPSNPWIAGIGNLFTREAFAAARAALKPGGVMCQWMHRYGMGEREFKSVLATFGEVFPHAQLWAILPGSDYLLIGSAQPLDVDAARLDARMREERVAGFLRKVLLDRPEDLLACFVADRERLRELSAGAPLHTDDNLLLEFAAPKTLLPGGPAGRRPVAHFRMADWRVSPERLLGGLPAAAPARREFLKRLDLSLAGQYCFDQLRDHVGSPADLVAASLRLAPRQLWAQAEQNRLPPPTPETGPLPPGLWAAAARDAEAAVRQLESAPAPDDPQYRASLSRAYADRALQRINAGRLDEAAVDLDRAEQLAPDSPAAAFGRVCLARRRGDLDAVLAAAGRAKDAGVPTPAWSEEIARAFLEAGRMEQALGVMERVLSSPAGTTASEAAPFWVLRAEVLARPGDLAGLGAAAEALQMRQALQPLEVAAWLDLAVAQLRWGEALDRVGSAAAAQEQRRRARRNAHAACVLAPSSADARVWLARAWSALGEREAAAAALLEARVLGGAAFQAPADLQELEK